MDAVILLVPYSNAHWTAHAGAANAAVAAGVLVEILLVIVLGVVERRRIEYLGGDASMAGGGEPILIRLARGFSDALLLRRVGVDRGSILGAHVVALPHA